MIIMDSLSNKILKFSRKYFGVMILFAVCFGILLTVTKYMFSDTAVRTGDYLFTRTIMIQNKTGNVDNNFDYVGFWRSTANIDKFLSSVSSTDFDFSKIDSAWNRKNRSQQIDWIRNSIIVSSFRGNVYEIGFKFEDFM